MLMKPCTIALKVLLWLSDVLVNFVMYVMNCYKDNVVRQLSALSTSVRSILSLIIFCHLNINARD